MYRAVINFKKLKWGTIAVYMLLWITLPIYYDAQTDHSGQNWGGIFPTSDLSQFSNYNSGNNRTYTYPRFRIAVVIVGDLRTFRLPEVREQQLKHVIWPLRSAHHLTHTFFHVEDPLFLTRDILNSFEPATVTASDLELVCPPTKYCEGKKLTSNLPSFSICRMAHAWRAVEEFERKVGKKFDWVYKTRQDVIQLRDVPLPNDLDGEVVHVNRLKTDTGCTFPYFARAFAKDSKHTGVQVSWARSSNRGKLLTKSAGDLLSIMDRKYAKTHFNVIQAFHDCKLRLTPCQRLVPEQVLSYWHAKHSIPVRMHPWFWLIVREGIGPLCYMAIMVQDPGTPWEPLWRECREFQKRIMPSVLQLQKDMEDAKKTNISPNFSGNLKWEEFRLKTFEGSNASLFDT